jgi:hypothetical protein
MLKNSKKKKKNTKNEKKMTTAGVEPAIS